MKLLLHYCFTTALLLLYYMRLLYYYFTTGGAEWEEAVEALALLGKKMRVLCKVEVNDRLRCAHVLAVGVGVAALPEQQAQAV